MVLHREDGASFQRDACNGVVIEVNVCELHVRVASKESRSTTNPWFCDVISALPVMRFLMGWFTPRWPLNIFTVFNPWLNANTW